MNNQEKAWEVSGVTREELYQAEDDVDAMNAERRENVRGRTAGWVTLVVVVLLCILAISQCGSIVNHTS